MKLWSIQPADIYTLIQETGTYRFDEKKAIEQFDLWAVTFRKSYDWLAAVMNEKIGSPPEGVAYPVWAWHTYDGRRKHADLRQRQGDRGERMVCMELEVPDSEALLSDFDAWHYVLNDFYYGDSHSDEEFDRECEWLDSLSSERQREEKEKSWQKIFDLERRDDEWDRNGFYIQACFWELKKEYIRKVKFFKSK